VFTISLLGERLKRLPQQKDKKPPIIHSIDLSFTLLSATNLIETLVCIEKPGGSKGTMLQMNVTAI